MNTPNLQLFQQKGIPPMRPLNLTDAVADLAPLDPPPCFHNRQSWREYLASAAAGQNNRRRAHHVILRTEDGSATFNWEYPFCRDCNAQHSLKMTAEGRCDPDHLKKRAPVAKQAEQEVA